MNRWLALGLFLVWSCLTLVAPSVSADTTETSHFLVVFQPSNASLAKKILDSLEEARETLTVELGVEHDHPLKVKLIPHLAHQGLARYLPDRQIMEVLTEGGLTRTFRGQLPPEASGSARLL